MKKIDNISDFEHLFKKEMSGHSTPPPADAWANVAASTAGQSAGILSQASSFLGSATNLLKVALFAGGIAAVGIAVYTENTDTNTSTENIETAPSLTTEEQKEQQTPIINDDSIATLEVDGNKPARQDMSFTKKPTLEAANERSSGAKLSSETTDKKAEAPTEEPNQQSTTKSDITDIKPLPFEISNPKPCLGEEVTLHSQAAGSWYQDGKLLATNSKVVTTSALNKGAIVIALKVGETKTSKTIYVQGSEAQIISTTHDNKHHFSLADQNQIANWYIDDQLVVTNAKECSHVLTKVGEHSIRAVVTNNPCALTTSTTVTTKPVGSIRYYNIITVDGDGKNDVYDVEIEGYENYSIQIFDIESNKPVFFATDPANKWNGKVNNTGIDCPAGSYVAKISYTLIGEAPTTKSTKITLKRP